MTKVGSIPTRDAMTVKIEYRMVVDPNDPASKAGLRFRHYIHPKRDYVHARKGLADWATDRAAGRFQNTWKQEAKVYIETREVSKWSRLDMSDAAEVADATTS